MKISVVIPVYNAEKFIAATLGSVVAAAGRLRDGDECEVIAVDDGSTDGSGAILDEYAAKDPRFCVIHQPNGGEGAARNAGMDRATGDIIAFLDADDTWHPDALRLIAETREKTGADVIRYGWMPVDSHDRGFEPLPAGACGRIEDLSTRRESTIRFCTLGAATAVSRAACGDIRFCGLTQGADLVYVLDCLLRTGKAAYIDAPLLHYLMHPGQISRKVTKELVLGTCGYIPEIAERCARLDGGEEAREDTRRYICVLVFRRLLGSWRMFGDASDREEIRLAFWKMLDRLVAMPGFFTPARRRLFAGACRRRSAALLRIFAVGACRASRRRSACRAVFMV